MSNSGPSIINWYPWLKPHRNQICIIPEHIMTRVQRMIGLDCAVFYVPANMPT